MRVVLAAIAEFEPEPSARTHHITHGMVKLEGGKKMSSRKGNIITALEILEAAREAARQSQVNTTEENMLSAVKYAFAKARIGGDIVYNPTESIALEGNSGPYLQYAHARARSILGKAQNATPARSAGASEERAGESGMMTSEATSSPEEGRVPLDQKMKELLPDERLLTRKLTEYPEVIEKATAELMPHHICTYLYELAQEFNRFYEKNRVIGDEREVLRLGLFARMPTR
jgi:arginyl-tRNA synthetase